jgi:hypothetical protein
MSDVDRLREAMAQPPAEQFAEVDVERVMHLGGRARLRRRLAIGSGALAVLALVVGGMVGIQTYQHARSQPSAPASISVADAESVGGLVDTGLRDGTGEIVLYLQDSHTAAGLYRLVMATEDTDGRLTSIAASEADLSTSGFHGIAIGRPGGRLTLFGAFKGPVQQIQTTAEGDVGSAAVAQLKTVLFWAQPTSAGTDFDPARVKFIAVDGNQIPTVAVSGLGH